jgi:hypothetical protein
MIDAGRVVGSIALVTIASLVPLWLCAARGAKPVALSKPTAVTRCLLPAADMRRRHPALLAEWRTQVVRQGGRGSVDGVPPSLTGACLGCHGKASAFCDTCHAQVAVSLSCWGCHASTPSTLTAQASGGRRAK